jgi:cobalamin synthase
MNTLELLALEDLRFGSHGVLSFVLLVLFQGVQLRSSELILPRHHYARMVIAHTGSSFPANPQFPRNQNSVFNTRLDL